MYAHASPQPIDKLFMTLMSGSTLMSGIQKHVRASCVRGYTDYQILTSPIVLRCWMVSLNPIATVV